jgi:hypothetical protein
MSAAAAASLAAATDAFEAFAGPEKAASSGASGVKTAGIRLIPIEGGKYKVWTKKVGSGRIKMLLLHGGPGITHEYFECFEDFLPQQGIEFFYYDQPIPTSRTMPLSGRSTVSARKWSRCGRGSGSRTSTCSGTPGAACWASSTP